MPHPVLEVCSYQSEKTIQATRHYFVGKNSGDSNGKKHKFLLFCASGREENPQKPNKLGWLFECTTKTSIVIRCTFQVQENLLSKCRNEALEMKFKLPAECTNMH